MRCGAGFVAMRWAVMAARVLCVVALGAAVSCARKPRAGVPAVPAGSPVVRGAESGLELWWWVVTDQRVVADPAPEPESKPGKPPPKPVFVINEPGMTLEQGLAPYLARPTAFTEATVKLWRSHGLRIVSVPVADLEKLQRSLRLTGPVHKQWFGQLADWTDVVRGPEASSTRVIMVGDKPEELRPGRLRLMARCWMYPVASMAGAPAAGLRLELVPQFEPAASERSRLQLSTARRDGDGNVDFPSLLAGLSIEKLTGEPDAILIVPDAPGADWSKTEAEQTEAGPEVDMPPTIGEAMLAALPMRNDKGTAVSARSRAVVILIPRLPERFELLGR